jgi:hypothetical protein
MDSRFSRQATFKPTSVSSYGTLSWTPTPLIMVQWVKLKATLSFSPYVP